MSYYGSAMGQFLSRDPAFAATLSPYGYTGNDPVNGSDPTGLICGKTFGSGTYDPACLTCKGYLQNCNGSECPAHSPVAKCPHANEQLPGAGKTPYYPCPPGQRPDGQAQGGGKSSSSGDEAPSGSGVSLRGQTGCNVNVLHNLEAYGMGVLESAPFWAPWASLYHPAEIVIGGEGCVLGTQIHSHN